MKEELLNIKLAKKYNEGLFEYKEGLDNIPEWPLLQKNGWIFEEHLKLYKLIEIEHMNYVEDNDFIVEIYSVPTTKQLTINCKGQDIEIDAVRLLNDDIDSIISDIPIKTVLKEEIGEIMFANIPVNDKRIKLKKLQRSGLAPVYVKMLLKLLEYVSQI